MRQHRLDLIGRRRAVHVDLYANVTRGRAVKQSLEYLGRSERVVYRRDVCRALASFERYANVGVRPKVVSPTASGRYDKGPVWLFVARDRQGVARPLLRPVTVKRMKFLLASRCSLDRSSVPMIGFTSLSNAFGGRASSTAGRAIRLRSQIASCDASRGCAGKDRRVPNSAANAWRLINAERP